MSYTRLFQNTTKGRKNLQVKDSTIKIIGGKYRGKKLNMPKSNKTRSTKSILKESFFNTIRDELFESIFIEGFAGSGSIGFEALSQGAKEAIFIEKDKEGFKTLKQNRALFENESIKLINGCAFEELPKILRDLNGTILYLDPPFSIRDGYEDIYSKCQNLIESIKNRGVKLIVVEHEKEIPFEERVGNFYKEKSRNFGKSALSYYFNTI